jgi:hypothetical protein
MNMVRGSTWTGNIAHIDTKKVSRQTWDFIILQGGM